jgi:hypothetical protein
LRISATWILPLPDELADPLEDELLPEELQAATAITATAPRARYRSLRR